MNRCMHSLGLLAYFAFLDSVVPAQSSGVPKISSAISGIMNTLTEGPVPNHTKVERHDSRILGQSCKPYPVTGLQFCSVLNGINLTSIGGAWANSLDIGLGTEFQFAASVGFKYGDFRWTLPDSSTCKSAFASYACLDGVENFHCTNGVHTMSGVCKSTCQEFLSRCSDFTSAQIYSVCDDMPQDYGCFTGVQQSSAVPTITAKKPGDKCTAQVVRNMASCTVLNGLELTQDGLTVADGVDLSISEIIQISADSLVDSPACKAAAATLVCTQKAAPYHCIGGVQALVTPCPSVCTSYFTACSPGLSASQIASACAVLASTLPASASCAGGAKGATVSTAADAAAPTRWQLAAIAIATSACALTAYAVA